ncbi:hypothetical protein VNO78_20864 [Psophocarpus tetragonolobus]|uniref:Uncharacterized protein n=1 Tax=Psophocarpus tetragonolobus TaxID=3891 RepID=A0AAN9XHI6_PSOTE
MSMVQFQLSEEQNKERASHHITSQSQRRMMGARRRSILATLAFLMLMGIAVYFRLWAIHYNLSSDDTQLLRHQFDIANREAMDESAEWRLRYDQEVVRTKNCLHELQVLRESTQKGEDVSGINHKLAILQKENAVLHERLETLKRELDEERLKRGSRLLYNFQP